MMLISRKLFVLALVLAGIVLSLLNFIPRVQAGTFHGTVTIMTDPDMLYQYYQIYGEAYMYRHWMGEDLMYCLGIPSNCQLAI